MIGPTGDLKLDRARALRRTRYRLDRKRRLAEPGGQPLPLGDDAETRAVVSLVAVFPGAVVEDGQR